MRTLDEYIECLNRQLQFAMQLRSMSQTDPATAEAVFRGIVGQPAVTSHDGPRTTTPLNASQRGAPPKAIRPTLSSQPSSSKLVLEFLQKHGPATVPEICEATRIPRSNVANVLYATHRSHVEKVEVPGSRSPKWRIKNGG